MADVSVPVLIVGGGGCGLAASIFLSGCGIGSLLIERHSTPSPMPKARWLNRRTMEVFRQHGVAAGIYEQSLAASDVAKIRWSTSLGGTGPFDRRTLFEMSTCPDEAGADLSPCTPTVFPQVRLEPYLRQCAERVGPQRLRFGCELLTLEDEPDAVLARVRDRASGSEFTVRAHFVIAADAGKTIGPLVGARLEGADELADMATVYFAADLSAYVDDDQVMSYWFANPEGDPATWSGGVLGKLGPTQRGRHSQEWMFHFSFRPDDPRRSDDAALVPRIRELLKIPDLQPRILGVGHWIVQGLLADRYRFGRVFLAGDAAHRHTPTTGLGLNSAVHDAHNLAWKLAAVLKGQAGPALLDSYEQERRPVARRNVDWALFTFSNHQLTGAAIGIVPGAVERSRENFAKLLEDSDAGAARRRRFHDVMQVHRTEFQAVDLDIGIRYDAGAFVPDGSDAPTRDPLGRDYVPTTRAGARLPHASVSYRATEVSTLDLVDPKGFVVLVETDSEAWEQAARAAGSELHCSVTVANICDERGAWADVREIEADGAILVRPDGHIGWRAFKRPHHPAAALVAALRQCLGLPSAPP